jgi:hypothetical protein
MGATFPLPRLMKPEAKFFLQPNFSGFGKRIFMQVWADQVSSKTSWLFGRHNVVYSSYLQSCMSNLRTIVNWNTVCI